MIKALSDCVSAVMSVYCHDVYVQYSHSLLNKRILHSKGARNSDFRFFIKQIFAMLSLSAYITFSPYFILIVIFLIRYIYIEGVFVVPSSGE